MAKKKFPISFPPMADFDTCSFCGSHNGPWTWLFINNNVYFACDECCERHKERELKLRKSLG